jgi:hypothetical protein
MNRISMLMHYIRLFTNQFVAQRFLTHQSIYLLLLLLHAVSYNNPLVGRNIISMYASKDDIQYQDSDLPSSSKVLITAHSTAGHSYSSNHSAAQQTHS